MCIMFIELVQLYIMFSWWILDIQLWLEVFVGQSSCRVGFLFGGT